MMICKLCGGTQVVQNEIMPGVVTVGPCPNCTGYVHSHYEHELEEVLIHEEADLTTTHQDGSRH